MIELRALGTAEIHTGSATLTPSQEIVFATALYMILEHGKPINRGNLASLLWPTASDTKRAHRFRQTIWQMKKLGIATLADRNRVELPPNSVRTDWDEPDSTLENLLTRAKSVEWLAGYEPCVSERFRDWLDLRRLDFNTVATRLLIQALDAARRQADWKTVEIISSKVLALDAYNESAILAQSEAAAMLGGKRKAVSILDRFLSDIGDDRPDLQVPARILRRRIVDRMPDRPNRLNAELHFVGRTPEMELLSQKLSGTRRGNGGCILVTGEPGIGKSRLSAELGRFGQLQGDKVEQVLCRRTDIHRPLSLFADIVPRLRELPGAIGCAPETIASLKRLTDYDQGSRETSRLSDSEGLFSSVRAALFDLIDSIAAERCILILIDDVQWLDIHSAKLLAQMAEWAEAHRMLFVLNSRPGSNHFLDYVDQSKLGRISLGPLIRSASDSLLQSIALMPGKDVDPGFIDWCLSVAEGNPFFLQELAHQWIETGHKYEAPPSVTNVIEGRISRLSREALQVLQTSATLADHATVDRVEQVLQLNAHQLLSAIEELSSTAMLKPNADSLGADGAQIRPRHELISAAAVSHLDPISLAFLHRRAADVLESEITKDATPTALLWACANHRHVAGDKDRALALSLSCAEHLLALGLAKESSEAFQKSLDYCCTDEERLTVLPRLAFALQTDGKWTRSKEVLASCIRLNAKLYPDSHAHNQYELLLLEARYNSSLDYQQLLDDLTLCIECTHAPPAHRVRAAVYALKIATDVGPAVVVDALYQSVAPVLAGADVPEEDALETEIVYRTLRSDRLIAVADLRRFLAAGNPGILDQYNRLVTVASACRLSGRYQEGMEFVSEAIRHAKSYKLQYRLAQAHLVAVRLHLAAEQYDLADATLQQAERWPTTLEDPRTHAEPLALEARIALEKGDVQRASVTLSKLVEPPPTYSASRRAYSFALQIRLKVLQNERTDAIRPLVAMLKQALAPIQGIGLKDFETYSLYVGLTAIGQQDEGLDMLRSYVSVRRHSRWPLSARIDAVLSSLDTPQLSAAPCNADIAREIRQRGIPRARRANAPTQIPRP